MTEKPIAVVTGATGGIGRAIARRLSARFQVIGIHLQSTGSADWLGDVPGGQLASCDLTDHDATTSLVEGLIERVGVPSLLVNAAGIVRDSLFSRMSYEDWAGVIGTNLVGLFSITQPVFRSMCELKRGRIVNVSSVNGQRGQVGQCNYSASKAGVHGFTMSLALEGARYGVTVNTVSPGYTDTPMLAGIRSDVMERIVESIPLRRLASADEVASVVDYLACDAAAYVTGADISVNGGLHLK